MVVFVFKQKTAYEMRISDWSSDVCSSDLLKVVDDIGNRERWPVAKSLVETANVARLLPKIGFLAQISPYFVDETERLKALKSGGNDQKQPQIGRASGRERVCQYV